MWFTTYPITVDRVIFSLINMMQLKVAEHFEESEKGGVYLNAQGKRIFVKAFDEKMNSVITVNNKAVTYRQLIENEIFAFQRSLMKDEKYKPYKYY